jgi:type IV pilus assembly protein PilW
MNADLSRPSMRRPSTGEAGFTIVEMMVAMAISLVVVIGFAATFVNMKRTFNSQNELSDLQDNERLASLIFTSSLDEAGYFPTGANPAAVPKVPPQILDRSGIATSTDPVGGKLVAPNYLLGTTGDATATPPVQESISTAYISSPGDGLLSCQGGSNAGTTNITIRNIFYVDATTNTLGCAVYNGTATTPAPGAAFAPLITGVKSMSVLYGVDTDGDKSIDSYFLAKDVTAGGYWNNVKNVQIRLDFINPNAKIDGKPTIPMVQIINVMNNKQ